MRRRYMIHTLFTTPISNLPNERIAFPEIMPKSGVKLADELDRKVHRSVSRTLSEAVLTVQSELLLVAENRRMKNSEALCSLL